jgi:hypothetical protein
MTITSTLKRFECPRCSKMVEARAECMGHRCPAAKSQLVMFIMIDKEPSDARH